MTGYRNLLISGKIPNFWCGNTARIHSSNNDIFCTLKYVRRFRNSRHQIKSGGHLPEPKVFGFENGPPNMRRAWKPFIFTIAFSSASIGAAAVWQYENNRSHTKSLFKNPGLWFDSHVNHQKRGSFRQEINRLWNSLTDGEKVFFPICFINVLVYIAWQIPNFQPTLLKYFCSNPSARSVCWPLVLSTFSHYRFLHLAANMYVLHNFCAGTVSSLGKEQFVGLYMAAGCISSLTSLLYKSAFGIPGLSLGASGAIMAIIGYVCTAYPETELSLIFFPFLHFKAHHAIKAVMALDAAGLLFRWQFFDHAAHLGGAAVGIAWYYYGNYYIWQNRKYVVQAWHDFRSSFDK